MANGRSVQGGNSLLLGYPKSTGEAAVEGGDDEPEELSIVVDVYRLLRRNVGLKSRNLQPPAVDRGPDDRPEAGRCPEDNVRVRVLDD